VIEASHYGDYEADEAKKGESLGGSGVGPPPISLLLRQSNNYAFKH
jgi:hypothetical protein